MDNVINTKRSGSLFNGDARYININEHETIIIKGDYNDFDFSLHIYSESFNAYISQDMNALKQKYPEAYQTLTDIVASYLISVGA